MPRKLQLGLLGLAVAVLAGIGVSDWASRGQVPANPPAPQSLAGNIPPGEVGSRLAEFSATDIHGRALSSADLHGKVLLINYWATWCNPCEKEMPGLQKLQDTYRDRGLVVIGIAFNGNMQMGSETVEQFAARLKIRYPLVLDNPALQEVFGGIQGLPTTFLIDPERTIRFKVIGFEYTEKVEAVLNGIL